MKNKNCLPTLVLALLVFLTSACSVNGSSTQPVLEVTPTTVTTSSAAAIPPKKEPVSKTAAVPTASPTAASSVLQKVSGTYVFSEGPAVDLNGSVYFSDVSAGKIYKWSPDGRVSVFVEGLKGPNGLEFAENGLLIACEGGLGRLISIDMQGKITVLVEKYNQLRFNEPNDLWIDAQGGIYFTDPAYTSPVVQDGEHVYYLSPDRSQVQRVISDLVRPNGIVGTSDGKTLYVTDHGAGKTYTYTIGAGGALTHKELFVPVGSDGMTLDASGSLYLTTPNKVQVYDAAGNHLRDIATPENPTNVAFGGADHLTLFITARTAVYLLPVLVNGATPASTGSRSGSGTPLRLADTGQVRDYTATFGEDADYTLNPPAYTVNGDGTVTDQVTGWMWQQVDGGEMIFAKAGLYCQNLDLGGYTDWRLPFSYELLSIVDLDRKPALNPTAFPVSEAGYWWTATEQVGDSTRAWVVNAGGGIGAHLKSETLSAGGTRRIHARCMRGGSGILVENLTSSGDGTVMDHNTGLVWQQAEVTPALNWEAALKTCENLALASRSDWRLPNIKELRSISNDTLMKPSLNKIFFPGAQAARYWSSTSLDGKSESAWFVDFLSGLTSYNEKTGLLLVRCVSSVK
jgi:gluconolactonase